MCSYFLSHAQLTSGGFVRQSKQALTVSAVQYDMVNSHLQYSSICFLEMKPLMVGGPPQYSTTVFYEYVLRTFLHTDSLILWQRNFLCTQGNSHAYSYVLLIHVRRDSLLYRVQIRLAPKAGCQRYQRPMISDI